MKILNKGLLKRVLAPALGVLLMLMAVTIGEGSSRRNNPTPAKPSQESSMRGSLLKAQRTGRVDGLKVGRRDHRRGQPSNFQDKSAYQDATNGYNPKMGSKTSYQQHYRQGFENGYRDGWNGY